MTRTGLLPLLSLVAACGCSSLGAISDLNPFAKKYVHADAKNPATEVACIWQPGEGPNENSIPARGFSGQVFFFTRNGSEPALVNGTIRFYLFADRGTPEERGKPIKQFDFTPEAWALHATLTALGPGYSVFIPYPQTEAYQVRCQLRARFIPNEGPTIWSDSVTITLEGPPQPGAEPAWWSNVDRTKSPPTVIDTQVTHETKAPADIAEAKGEQKVPPRKLRTDTFSLDEIQQTTYEVPADRVPRTDDAPRDAELLAGESEFDPELLREVVKKQSGLRKSARKKSYPLEDDAHSETPSDHPLGRAPAKPSWSAHPLEAESSQDLSRSSNEPVLSRIRLGARSFSKPAHPLTQRAAWKPLGSSLPPIDKIGDGPIGMATLQPVGQEPSADANELTEFSDWKPAGP